MTAKLRPGELYEDPVAMAAHRAETLDAEVIGRVREELRAGPMTHERLRSAVYQLAGLGSDVVEIVVDAVEEIYDGVWFGGGTYRGEYMIFPLHPLAAPAMAESLTSDPGPLRAWIPATDLIRGSDRSELSAPA